MKNQKTFLTDRDDLHKGDLVILIRSENLNSNREVFSALPLASFPDGVPGNADSSICRFHGWRGTTNNISRSAYGVRRVNAVEAVECKDGRVMLKVRVGKDLHPDWD